LFYSKWEPNLLCLARLKPRLAVHLLKSSAASISSVNGEMTGPRENELVFSPCHRDVNQATFKLIA
jgi:hypothetical protein